MPTSNLNLALEEADDADLLQLSAHNPNAFGELVARHQAFVFGAAFRVTQNRDTAQDIAQEAFLRAFRTAGEYRGDGPVRAWLYRIARNLAINAVTRAREFPSSEGHDIPVDRSPEWHLLRAADIAEVRTAIAELPDALRIPLVEREYHDRTYEDIAERLDIPLNTVRTRIHRARKALEAALEGTR